MFNEIAACINNNKQINENIIYELISSFVKCNHLEEYLKIIEIHNGDFAEGTAYYNYGNRKLGIDKIKVMKNINKKINNESVNSLYDVSIIFILYHELVHVMQYQKLNEEEDSIEKRIFYQNLFRACNDRKHYYQNYYNYSIELHANLIAYIKTLELIECMNIPKIIKKKIINNNFILTKELLDDLKDYYKQSSPVERFGIELSNFDYKDYTNYERISLGLPINKITQDKILKMEYKDAIRFKKYVNKDK